MLRQIVDGFTLNPWIRNLPYRWYANALQSIETLRRANMYRCRWWVFPDDINTPIPGYGTQEFQVSISPGAYLWGWQVNQFDGHFDAVVPSNVVFQLTEACTGIPLFYDWAAGNPFTNAMAAPTTRGWEYPHLLSEPRLIMEPGLVNVEINNTSMEPITCQLLLYFAEPCTAIAGDYPGLVVPRNADKNLVIKQRGW